MMLAYKYNPYFCGVQECQICPMTLKKTGETVYLLPANCTFDIPLKEKDGCLVKWNGIAWEYENIPVNPVPEAHIPTKDELIAQLDAQYSTDKSTLMEYYLQAMIEGDTETQDEIKQELADLAAQYDSEMAQLEEG